MKIYNPYAKIAKLQETISKLEFQIVIINQQLNQSKLENKNLLNLLADLNHIISAGYGKLNDLRTGKL